MSKQPAQQAEPAKEPLVVGNGQGDSVSSQPDKFTKVGSSFFEGGAPNQIFKFEKFGVSYGTDDKSHAAAIILSLLIGILLLVIFIIGSFVERTWIPDALKILGTAFTFTIGVAIGQGTSSKNGIDNENNA